MSTVSIRSKIKTNKSVLSFVYSSYSLFSSFSFRVNSKNKLDKGTVLLKRSKIKVNGVSNKIIIKDLARLIDCNIIINGHSNTIFLDEKVKLNGTDIRVFGNGNYFHMGKFTSTNDNVEFNVLDGCKISIGNDCMFSRNIHLWTGDFHSILDESGERINKSKDIEIGNRVWIGTESKIFKGTYIADDNVIGACSVVFGKFEKSNSVLVGNPAKVIKEEINWTRENML